MPTSGSTDFTLDTNGIIKEALEMIGAIPLDTNPGDRLYKTCRTSLNLMCKSWMAKGKYLWALTEQNGVALILDQATISLGPAGADVTMEKPMRILYARLRETVSETDIPLHQITRDEYKNGYLAKTSVSSSGHPTVFYYDNQLDLGTIYLNGVPDSSAVADYTLQFDYPRRIEDFDNTDDDPDFLQEYLETLTTNLGVRIRSKFPAIKVEDIVDVIARAETLYNDLEVWTGDLEENVFFEPDREGW